MIHDTYEIPADRRNNLGDQIVNETWYLLLFLWQTLKGIFVAPAAPLTTGDKRPVVLVPGFLGRSESFVPLQRALHAQGHPCYIVPLGFQIGNILDKARILSQYISTNNLKDCYVVAHSMGGLITVGALLGGEFRIRRAWSLGSPLWGTVIVRAAYVLAVILFLWGLSVENHWAAMWLLVYLVPAMQQMKQNSDLLRFYTPRYPELERMRSVFASFDPVVLATTREPGSSSRFGRENDLLFPEIGHNNLFMGENGIQCVVDLVTEAQEQDSEKPRPKRRRKPSVKL